MISECGWGILIGGSGWRHLPFIPLNLVRTLHALAESPKVSPPKPRSAVSQRIRKTSRLHCEARIRVGGGVLLLSEASVRLKEQVLSVLLSESIRHRDKELLSLIANVRKERKPIEC